MNFKQFFKKISAFMCKNLRIADALSNCSIYVIKNNVLIFYNLIFI